MHSAGNFKRNSKYNALKILLEVFFIHVESYISSGIDGRIANLEVSICPRHNLSWSMVPKALHAQ